MPEIVKPYAANSGQVERPVQDLPAQVVGVELPGVLADEDKGLYHRRERLVLGLGGLLIAQGEGLAYIKDQLGHYSIQMTVDIYGHLVPGENRAAVDKLDDPSYAGNEAEQGATKTKPGYV